MKNVLVVYKNLVRHQPMDTVQIMYQYCLLDSKRMHHGKSKTVLLSCCSYGCCCRRANCSMTALVREELARPVGFNCG